MASITRRTWIDLKDEFIRASRGIRYPNWAARAEQLINEAYLDLCTLYHHKELEEVWKVSVSQSGFSASYPDDAHIIFVVAEIDAEDLPSRFLELVHVGQWSGIFRSEEGRPRQYGTFQKQIYFNCKLSEPRNYNVYYQRYPSPPDFSGASTSEIAQVWDAHLVELALVKAGIRNSDDQLAMLNAQMFKDFVSQQPQPLLIQSTAPAQSNVPTQDAPQSGRAT